MKLIIDFGNTYVKLAVFSANMVVKQYQFRQLTIPDLKEIANKHAELRSVIISSVANDSDEIRSFLKEKYHFYELDSQTPLPIKNKYKSPETLGKDRIAAVVAASYLYPDQNVLVIDAGSCITFDFINEHNEYYGGSITAGLQMRLRSIHEFTANLPLLEARKVDYLIGSTTEESILSGVYNGLISEIDGIIGAYKDIYEKLTVILSGGDHIYFDKRLKNNIFALPNIVMIGLNIILEFNENKK